MSTDFYFQELSCGGDCSWNMRNMRNSEIVSKLLCPTHSFGCASMTLRKRETGERIRIS